MIFSFFITYNGIGAPYGHVFLLASRASLGVPSRYL
eukprot:UN14247